jgi:hypothetical protein
MIDARGRRLRAALACVLVGADAPELRLVRRWLDSWTGIGLIVVGMEHRGLRLALSQIAEGEWRAVFMGPNPRLAPEGFGVAPTAWRAVQRAAWAALGATAGPARS